MRQCNGCVQILAGHYAAVKPLSEPLLICWWNISSNNKQLSQMICIQILVRPDHVGNDVTEHFRTSNTEIPHKSTETYKAVRVSVAT